MGARVKDGFALGKYIKLYFGEQAGTYSAHKVIKHSKATSVYKNLCAHKEDTIVPKLTVDYCGLRVPSRENQLCHLDSHLPVCVCRDVFMSVSLFLPTFTQSVLCINESQL